MKHFGNDYVSAFAFKKAADTQSCRQDFAGIAMVDLNGRGEMGEAPEIGYKKRRWQGIQRGKNYTQIAREWLMPSNQTILLIVNKIFRTKSQDVDAVDLTAAWAIILEEIRPYDDIVPVAVLYFQAGMTWDEAAKAQGLPKRRTALRFQLAMDKLRHPCRIRRIRNSIMGWPNLYRDS